MAKRSKRTSKRTSSKRRSYKRRRRSHGPSLNLKKQTVYTIGAIWLWLIAGTVMLSFFAEGEILTLIRQQLTGYIGWGMFALPPILVSMSLLFFDLKSRVARPNVPLGLIMMVTSLLILTQAGLYGEMAWQFIASALSGAGAVLGGLALLVVGLIVLLEATLDRFVSFMISMARSMTYGFVGMFSGGDREESAKPRFDEPTKAKLLIKGQEEDKKEPVKTPLVINKGEMPKVADKGKTEIALTKSSPASGMWEYPPLSLLSDAPSEKADRGDVRKNADIIEDTLQSFGVKAVVKEVNRGPAVTQYAFEIAQGTKLSKITGLSSDLALALAAPTGQVRIEAPIPGKKLVGVEIPNKGLEFVTLKNMLQSQLMQKHKSKLAVALGLNVSGEPVVADIAKMPHVMIAGSTGSGKSVLVNAFITSLLFRTTPAELRMIMVDPKRVELTGYNGVQHLLSPVIVEQDKTLSALRYAMNEMDNRYKQFAEVGVRNIDSFNELSGFQAMPYIVIFIDELADLMAYAQAEVEDAICRLAQMARATGIHLVLATQRPSVDVITGLIKANIPTRIAFNVSSMIDSRVVLDTPGAEKLLGRGDMLYIPPEQSKPSRIQGTFVSEKEVQRVVEYIKEKNPNAEYSEEVTAQTNPTITSRGGSGGSSDGRDPKFDEAVRLVVELEKASASLLQRKLSLGYARAARIIDQLEDAGLVGPQEGSKPRELIMSNIEAYFSGAAQTENQ